MKILILEDDAERCKHFSRALIGHEVDITEFSKEAIKLLSNKNYDILFLDHDLGGKTYVDSGDGTGYEVAKWLSHNTGRKPKEIYLHSLNEWGRKNMKGVLPESIEAPFAWVNIHS